MVLWVDLLSLESLIQLVAAIRSGWDWSTDIGRLLHSHLVPGPRQMKSWRLDRHLFLFVRLGLASLQHEILGLLFLYEGWLPAEWVFPKTNRKTARLFLASKLPECYFSVLAFYSICQTIDSAQTQPFNGWNIKEFMVMFNLIFPYIILHNECILLPRMLNPWNGKMQSLFREN